MTLKAVGKPPGSLRSMGGKASLLKRKNKANMGKEAEKSDSEEILPWVLPFLACLSRGPAAFCL